MGCGPLNPTVTTSESTSPKVWTVTGRGFAIVLGLLAMLVMVGYTATFADRPIVLTEIDAVADADASMFARLIREYSPGRVFGEAARREGRDFGDIIQAHKVRHSLYAVIGHVLWRVFGPVARWLRLPEPTAILAVNAFLSAVNLVLFLLIARQLGISLGIAAPLGVIFAVALGPWVTGSLPESWTLTGTIMLAALWCSYRVRSFIPLGLIIGIGMLNYPFVAVVLAADGLRELLSNHVRAAVLRLTRTATLAIVVFVAGLGVQSFWDPELRPDRYANTVLWVARVRTADLLEERQFLPASDKYAFKGSLSAMFGTSILSNQPSRDFPPESLQTTLRGSWLGRAAFAAYAFMLLVAAVRAVRWVSRRTGESRSATALHAAIGLGLLMVLHWAFVHMSYWPAAFLLSAPLVPLLLLFVGLLLDPRRVLDRVAVVVATVLILINNVAQVGILRESLAERARPTAAAPVANDPAAPPGR